MRVKEREEGRPGDMEGETFIEEDRSRIDDSPHSV